MEGITVILATCNRAQILQGTLESFCDLISPKCGWQLIVVTNACLDNTNHVLEQFVDRLPLHFLEEPVRGKNRALNRALENIADGLVVFTDDDVLFQRDWLLTYEEAIAKRTDCSVFGGTILPEWSASPHSYVRNLNSSIKGSVYALTEPWWLEGDIIPDYIYGPNMAILSSIFKKGYRFNERIGPNGQDYAQGGETELTKRLAGDGYRCCHIKKAIVYHRITAEQLSKQCIYDRALRYGKGQEQIRSMGKEKKLFDALFYQVMLVMRLAKYAIWGFLLFPLTRISYYYLFVELRWNFTVTRGALISHSKLLNKIVLEICSSKKSEGC